MTVPYQSNLMQNTFFYNSASDVISFFVLGVTSFISFIFNKYSNDTCRLSAFFVDNYFHGFFFSTQTLSLVRLFILLFSILANQMPKVRVQQGIKRLETSHVGSSLAFRHFSLTCSRVTLSRLSGRIVM
jgi:hypothetical protein